MIAHRLGAAALLFALPQIAQAGLPENNRVGDWSDDQAIAAERYLLTPHTWGYVFAGLAVLALVAVAVWAWRRPAREAPPSPPDLSPTAHRRWKWAVIAGLVLFYTPMFAGEFSIYDDPQNIWLDETVTTLSWENARAIALENHRGVNQELMFLSLQLCWALFGKSYAGFFAWNLAMFPPLLLLIHRLGLELSGRRAVAVLGMAFFGVSPIIAELLGWMLVRGHYFGLLFALAACVAYLRYVALGRAPAEPGPAGAVGFVETSQASILVDRPAFAASRTRYLWLAASVVAFFLCQLGKPIFLYVPVWLVLFDVWNRRRDLGLVFDKIPYALVAVFFLAKIVDGGGSRGRIRDEYIGGSAWNTLALDANQFVEYLRSTVMPHQTGLRVPWYEPTSWWQVTGVPDILVLGFAPVASAVILGCSLGIAGLLAWRFRWPWALLWLVGSLATFAPVANFPVHTVVVAYRYTFSSTVLAALMLAAGTWHLLGVARERRWIVVGLAGAWLGVAAHHANENRIAWRSPAELWTRSARELYPHDGWAHYYAGKALQHERRFEEAAAHLELSARYLPQNRMVYKRLGDTYFELGWEAGAAENYERYFSRNRRSITPFYEKRLSALGLEGFTARR